MTTLAAKAENLVHDFGGTPALCGLSLTVAPGRVLALLGPNGAGKTTFLKILGGFLQPASGQAEVLGGPARNPPPDRAARLAWMGDNHAPPPWATLGLLEELQAGAVPGFDRPFFRRLIQEQQLDPRRPFGALSKGQRRWVLAALALASRAGLILMDEPADGLDPAARRRLYDHLRDQVTDTACAAIVATHVIADVERVADDVAIIVHGCLVLHAPLEDLRDQARQVEIEGVAELPDFGPGVTVLGRTQQGDTAIGWVLADEVNLAALTRCAGPAATVRPVDLETLYLAVAEHGTAAAANSEQETQ